jgi:hypothetical protein
VVLLDEVLNLLTRGRKGPRGSLQKVVSNLLEVLGAVALADALMLERQLYKNKDLGLVQTDVRSGSRSWRL